MVVEVLRETVAGGTNGSITALLMAPDVIFLGKSMRFEMNVLTRTYGVKHLFCKGDGDSDSSPVLGRRTRDRALTEAMRSKPLIDGSDTLGVRSDDSFDLFLGQVGSIPRMVRVADLV